MKLLDINFAVIESQMPVFCFSEIFPIFMADSAVLLNVPLYCSPFSNYHIEQPPGNVAGIVSFI